MRKTITPRPEVQSLHRTGEWFDLETVASVELPSEDPQHPFEDALNEAAVGGWKAALPGRQTIRLTFDTPQTIHRFRVQFKEEQRERSQEFAVFASRQSQPRSEVLRQQWNFSPSGSTFQDQEYSVDLQGVTAIELEIDPARHDQDAFATLQFLAVG